MMRRDEAILNALWAVKGTWEELNAHITALNSMHTSWSYEWQLNLAQALYEKMVAHDRAKEKFMQVVGEGSSDQRRAGRTD